MRREDILALAPVLEEVPVGILKMHRTRVLIPPFFTFWSIGAGYQHFARNYVMNCKCNVLSHLQKCNQQLGGGFNPRKPHVLALMHACIVTRI